MQRTHTQRNKQIDFLSELVFFAILRRRVPASASSFSRYGLLLSSFFRNLRLLTVGHRNHYLTGALRCRFGKPVVSSFKNSLTFAGFSSAKLLRSPMSSDKLYSSGNGSASMAPQELRPKGDAHFRVDGDKSTPGNARQLRRRSLALSSLGIVISFSVLSVDSGEDHCVTIESGPAFSTRVAIARVLPNNLRIFKLSKVITRDQ